MVPDVRRERPDDQLASSKPFVGKPWTIDATNRLVIALFSAAAFCR
jgi:hypothetical protein